MSAIELTVLLLALFGVKHFLCDFVFQNERMIAQKGIYGMPGGIEHSAVHALGTLIVLLIALPWTITAQFIATVLAALDGIIHYHIDWAKTNLSKQYSPKDREFWLYLGADQGLHYLTYILIIGILVL